MLRVNKTLQQVFVLNILVSKAALLLTHTRRHDPLPNMSKRSPCFQQLSSSWCFVWLTLYRPTKRRISCPKWKGNRQKHLSGEHQSRFPNSIGELGLAGLVWRAFSGALWGKALAKQRNKSEWMTRIHVDITKKVCSYKRCWIRWLNGFTTLTCGRERMTTGQRGNVERQEICDSMKVTLLKKWRENEPR